MNRKEILLIQLMEKSSEVAKNASNALIFGLNGKDHIQKEKSIASEIAKEINELIAIASLLADDGHIPHSAIHNPDAVNAKKVIVNKWMEHALGNREMRAIPTSTTDFLLSTSHIKRHQKSIPSIVKGFTKYSKDFLPLLIEELSLMFILETEKKTKEVLLKKEEDVFFHISKGIEDALKEGLLSCVTQEEVERYGAITRGKEDNSLEFFFKVISPKKIIIVSTQPNRPVSSSNIIGIIGALSEYMGKMNWKGDAEHFKREVLSGNVDVLIFNRGIPVKLKIQENNIQDFDVSPKEAVLLYKELLFKDEEDEKKG